MTDLVNTLRALLASERTAAIHANFDAVTRLSSEKERLLQLINAAPPPQADLQLLIADLTHNQILLMAMIKGVNAATHRLHRLSEVRDGLSLYGQDGRLSQVRTARPAIERKA